MLKDYMGRPMTPTSITLKVQVPGVEYVITSTSSTHVVGQASDGAMQGNMVILRDSLLIRAQRQTTEAIIQYINKWELIKIQTEEQEYTNFIFIQ